MQSLEIPALICFVLALIHTFSAKKLRIVAERCSPGSVAKNLFHLLGEVEVVFGVWAALLMILSLFVRGREATLLSLEKQNFSEAIFVFVILVICSTRPLLVLSTACIEKIAKVLPFPASLSFFISCLVVGPLFGSLITEPAAMTVTASLLLERFFSRPISSRFRYAILGLLFVNVSVGGALTHFAAPPVLVVAGKWGWDSAFMFLNFGWKAFLAIVLSTLLTAIRFRKELKQLSDGVGLKGQRAPIPAWVMVVHLCFLGAIIWSAHHPVVFIGIFLFFLGLTKVTKEYQTELKLKEGLLVGFFLAGIMLLGGPQRWWLEPILSRLQALPLYLSAIALTSITDNAALTYLGSLVPALEDYSKYYLVAGSLVGGGLTVIANAPNPVGYEILSSSFGEEGMSSSLLLRHALVPTLISAILFWL